MINYFGLGVAEVWLIALNNPDRFHANNRRLFKLTKAHLAIFNDTFVVWRTQVYMGTIAVHKPHIHIDVFFLGSSGDLMSLTAMAMRMWILAARLLDRDL